MSGSLTISMEVELGWGTHDRGEYEYFSPDGERESETLNSFLRICDKYGIPVTFDVVGHLMEESCNGTHIGPYPDNWWIEDPGTHPETDPLFYAPEFVRRIDNTDVTHEIGTHTYSHILCDDVPSETIRHELQRASEVHQEFGLEPPRSVVFPRHQTPPYDVFSDLGIEVVRRPIDDYHVPENLLKKFFWGVTRTHPVTELQREEGLVETPCTPHPSLSSGFLQTGQADLHPVLRGIPRPIRQRILRHYIKSAVDRAVEEDGHVHLWTHLFNIANDEHLAPIESGLQYLAKKRDAGEITIDRMRDLSKAIRDD